MTSGGPRVGSDAPAGGDTVSMRAVSALRFTACAAALLGFVPGCGGGTAPGAEFRVARVEPQPLGDGVRHVALNQSIKVWFSADVDPATVSKESVRVVDADGYAVPGRLEIGTRSVRFLPVPPVTPALDDGAFRPGEDYWLEVVGLPTSFAVGSADGVPLAAGTAVRFRALDDPAVLGLDTPFLPVDLEAAPLALVAVGPTGLPMAVGERVVTLRFSSPPLPTTVLPAAFEVVRFRPGSDSEPQHVGVESVQVVGDWSADGASYGSTVRVQLDRSAPLDPERDRVFLGFAGGPAALRDLRGTPIRAGEPIPIRLEPGDRVRLIQLAPDALELRRDPRSAVGFEVRDGRVVPRVWLEAGRGSADTRIARDGLTIDAADAGDHDYTEFRVPEGAVVRLVARDRPLAIRAIGDVTIDGDLVIDAPRRALPWNRGQSVDCAALLREAPIAIVAGGDLRVRGRIRHASAELPDPGATSLVLVAGGDVHLDGAVPPHTVVGVRPDHLHGSAEALCPLEVRLTPGLPAGVQLVAKAWTRWLTVPPFHVAGVRVRLDDVRGPVTGRLRVVPPARQAPDGRPLVDERLIVETPLEPLEAWDGMILQVGFEAIVIGGEALPSVAGFTVLER